MVEAPQLNLGVRWPRNAPYNAPMITHRLKAVPWVCFLVCVACSEKTTDEHRIVRPAAEERSVVGCYALAWHERPDSVADVPRNVQLLEAYARAPTRDGPGGWLEVLDTLNTEYPSRGWERFRDSLIMYVSNGLWAYRAQVAYTNDSILTGYGIEERDFGPPFQTASRLTARRRACNAVPSPAT